MPSKPATVSEYIRKSPKAVQSKLRQMRGIILAAVPDAAESLSYGMPYYAWNGRLAYFATFKNHIGLYVPTPIIEEHSEELAGYATAKATVQFPHGKPLPARLIRKLVLARMRRNELKRLK